MCFFKSSFSVRYHYHRLCDYLCLENTHNELKSFFTVYLSFIMSRKPDIYEKVSAYDLEMSQSKTANQLMTRCEKDKTQTATSPSKQSNKLSLKTSARGLHKPLRVCTKNLFFLFLSQNICCGYSKELSQ